VSLYCLKFFDDDDDDDDDETAVYFLKCLYLRGEMKIGLIGSLLFYSSISTVFL
jgi:hypothetical protein